MNTRKSAIVTTLAAIIAATTFATTSAQASPALTLENLKNGSYQIADSACGSTVVQLHNGKGSKSGMNVIFGSATFGKLTNKREPGAAVHLAYKDEMLGWQQQIVFLVERNGKLLQIAEMGMDEREQLKGVEIRDGVALIQTVADEGSGNKLIEKVTRTELIERKQGCELISSNQNWLTTENDQDSASRLVSLR